MAEERKVVKGTGEAKRKAAKKQEDKVETPVSIDAQERLAEILSDSPRLVSLNGTEWEVRALRMGTQYLIAKKAIEINKAENATMGDIIKQFAVNIPAVIDVLALALLNDKEKIYENGNESQGFSKLFYTTRDTLMWDCPVSDFAQLLFEVLSLIDISFFMDSNRILEIIKETTVAKTKRK